MGRKCHRCNARPGNFLLSERFLVSCRSRDFVKSSAERAHRWTRDAHRARGIAWTLFMRRERGPRLDMEPVDGSGKGVGEDDEREKAKPSGDDLPVKVHGRGHFLEWTSGAEEEGSKLGRLGLKLKTRTSL